MSQILIIYFLFRLHHPTAMPNMPSVVSSDEYKIYDSSTKLQPIDISVGLKSQSTLMLSLVKATYFQDTEEEIQTWKKIGKYDDHKTYNPRKDGLGRPAKEKSLV